MRGAHLEKRPRAHRAAPVRMPHSRRRYAGSRIERPFPCRCSRKPLACSPPRSSNRVRPVPKAPCPPIHGNDDGPMSRNRVTQRWSIPKELQSPYAHARLGGAPGRDTVVSASDRSVRLKKLFVGEYSSGQRSYRIWSFVTRFIAPKLRKGKPAYVSISKKASFAQVSSRVEPLRSPQRLVEQFVEWLPTACARQR